MTQPIEDGDARASARLKVVAAAACLLTSAACFLHLVQPQTYYLATRRVELQRKEYLDKELLAGLPEPFFVRWYTRDATWCDPLRPYILDRGTSEERTIYKVGTGRRSIADVFFREGRLLEIGEWELVQEGILSAWFYRRTAPPRSATDEVLARLRNLNPAAEPLRPEEARDALEGCRFDRGSRVDTMQPLGVVREGDGPLRLTTGPRPPEVDGSIAGGLPAGTRLKVRRWGPLTDGILVNEVTGQEYRVRASSMAGAFCPTGRCAPVGEVGVATLDLMVATFREGDRSAAVAIAPGLVRLPVWMERQGILRAGCRVRIRSWSPCGHRQAEVEILDAEDLPAVVKVPVAPPGLFEPSR